MWSRLLLLLIAACQSPASQEPPACPGGVCYVIAAFNPGTASPVGPCESVRCPAGQTCNFNTGACEGTATQVPNQGWIGGACLNPAACEYDGAICLVDGYPGGMCSLACSRLCPDSNEPGDAVTFCIGDPDHAGAGICVSRCDWNLFPGTGCREPYFCQFKPRFNEPSVSKQVCMKDGGSGATGCTGNEVPQPNQGLVEAGGLGGCPPGMTPIYSLNVCIDRFEAHLVEVLDGGREAPWSPYFNPGQKRIRARSTAGAVPQGHINQKQAAAACAEAGKRLCSRTEWELACRGPSGHTYPYGNVRQSGLCNDARSPHPVIEYFGTSDSWIWSQLGHSCINQLPHSLDLTGANTGCVTPGGVFDLMGNLHEWVDDPAGTFKGGYYVDTVINGQGCLYTTTAHNTSHWDYSTGFRCCADKP